MKQKFKSYKFWLAVLGGVLIIVQTIAKENGVIITDEVGFSIINAVCGVLVFLGIVEKPKQNTSIKHKTETNTQTQKTVEEVKDSQVNQNSNENNNIK